MSPGPADNATPYADLGPDTVLAAVEALGHVCDGRVLALNSYENRVYRVGLEDAAPLVAKFYRPGRWSDAAILEEHAFTAELRAAELSVVAPLTLNGATLHRYAGPQGASYRYALFPLQGGHAPELDHRDTLRHLGQTLARLHNVGAAQPFAHRLALSLESHADDPVDFLLDEHWLPPDLAAPFERLCDPILDHLDAAFERAGDVRLLRLHGDCHPGNILWREDTAHFVDLDDCLSGPAIQDLWMLLSGGAADQRRQFGWLLEGYRMFRDFDARELHLVEALRTMRLLHFNAWVARRWHDPAFPRAFPWFEEPRHWEGVIAQLQEQLAALQEPVDFLRVS